MTASRSVVLRLALEELRALPRGRFALAGVAVLAGALAVLAVVVGSALAGLDNFLVVSFVILPSAIAALAAGQMAGLRTSRFAQSLYTSPVRERDALAAKALASLVAGALVLVAPLPFVALAAWHLGAHPLLGAFLATGAGLVVFGTALGLALGVLLTGRSATAPVALAVSFMALSLVALPYAVDVHAREGGPDPLVARALRASPHVLLADATRLAAGFSPLESRDPALSAGLFALECVTLLAVAAWAYLREQGVEGWEAPVARRAVVALAAVAVLLVPTVVAAPGYDPLPPDEVRGRSASSMMRNGTAMLVERGLAASEVPFGDHWSRDAPGRLLVGEANARDLLVLLPVPDGVALRNVVLTIESRDGLALTPAGEVRVGDVEDPERGTQTRPSWGPQTGAPSTPGAVVRVPVTATPEGARDLTDNAFHVHVRVEYSIDGGDERRVAEVLFPVRADVPHARAQMALAGAPLLALSTIAAVARRVRVG